MYYSVLKDGKKKYLSVAKNLKDIFKRNDDKYRKKFRIFTKNS
jgi:hypothetical protein